MTGTAEATKYPPYSGPDAPCTKCDGGTMDEKYMPGGTVFVHLTGQGGCVYGYGSGPEWLFRECSSCGYGWPEQCKEASVFSVGDVLGALPPEPPVGTLLAHDKTLDGTWQPVMERREDGWHQHDWEGAEPMPWRDVFDRLRPLRIERLPA